MKRNLQRALSCLTLCTLLMTGLTVPASAARFRDVPSGHWAAEAIHRSVDLGLFRGRTSTTFGVGSPMSRGAFAVVLCRFFGWETPAVESPSFEDIAADDWYAAAVESARAHGAITLQSTAFRPDEPITREELAVTLVRALGLAPVSGLAQELQGPFHDVETNKGYLTMAYDLGLVNGTSAHAFSPDRAATREQTAVILMRLYDKLHTAAPGKAGMVTSPENLPDLTGFEAVAIPAAKLLQSGTVKVVSNMGKELLTEIRGALEPSGVKQLLAISGSENSFRRSSPAEAAEQITAAVEQGGYDGVLLDLRKLRSGDLEDRLNELARAVDLAMGDRLFYAAVQAPVWQGESSQAFDYVTLSRSVDRLVLQPISYEDEVNGYAVAPSEPLEEVYYGLRLLKDAGKLSLFMTTTGTVWKGTSKTGTVTGREVDALLTDKYTETYFSQRFGFSYLETNPYSRPVTVWYPDARSAAERTELMRLFGVDQVMLGELSGVSGNLLSGLQ